MTFLKSLAVAALTMTIAVPAHAATLHMVSRSLTYNPETLAKPEGAKRMLTRIWRTAGDLCRPAPTTVPVATSPTAEARCQREATADAVGRLDSPMVSKAFEEIRSRSQFARR